MDTWILAGQSNMQGIAPLDDPRRVVTVDPRVEVFSSSGAWGDATEPLHRLWESYTPAHRDLLRAGLPSELADLPDDELARRDAETRRVGAGLGPAFATRLAGLTGQRVGLIPCAHGGTTLEQWTPGFGGEDRRSTATFYGSMLDRVDRARSRPGVQVKGILWYQGESDATPARSLDYGDRLEAWIETVRRDLDAPELPVVIAQLGRFAGAIDPGDLSERSWDQVREAQRLLPSRVPGTVVVGTVDLGLSDPIHLGAPGLARLGQRMALLAAEEKSGPDVARVEHIGRASNEHLMLRVRCTGVREGWRDVTHLPGFQLCARDGVPIARLHVVDARPDPVEPTSILIVTAPLDPIELAGVYLSYGQGFDPVCLAVDTADLALPAFAAQPIVQGGAR